MWTSQRLQLAYRHLRLKLSPTPPPLEPNYCIGYTVTSLFPDPHVMPHRLINVHKPLFVGLSSSFRSEVCVMVKVLNENSFSFTSPATPHTR